MQFCDSLKVAYAFKSKELRNLQEKNINLFSQLQNENSKINLLENQIEKQKNEIQNFKKKRNNTIIYISVGFVSGVITTLLLTK